MKKKPTSTKPKRATKNKAGGSCPAATCSARFVAADAGEVVVNGGWVVASGPRVVALEYDLKTKRAEVVGSSGGGMSGDPPGVILSGENALYIDESKKGELTHIEFVDYVGWRVHSAEIAHYTLSVCLILSNELNSAVRWSDWLRRINRYETKRLEYTGSGGGGGDGRRDYPGS